jgi:hypothetical protein
MEETNHGIQIGSATITRLCSHDKNGWVWISMETPKHSGPDAIQIHVTRSGEVRIFRDGGGEWRPPATDG